MDDKYEITLSWQDGKDDAKPTINPVRVLSQDDDTIIVGGYGVLFGGKDLYGQQFNSKTEFMLDVVPSKLVTYDHALTREIPDFIGRTIKEQPDDKGIWIEAQLDASHEYIKEILELVEKGIIGLSSGSVGHLVQLLGDTIKRWPIVEYALTPTPAEPRLLGVERIKSIAEGYSIEQRDAMRSMYGEALVSADQDDDANVTMSNKNYEVNTMSEDMKDIKDDVVADNDNDKPDVNIDDIAERVAAKIAPVFQEQLKSVFQPEDDDDTPRFLLPKKHNKHAHLGDPDPVEDFYRYIYTGEAKIKKHVNREAMLPIGPNGKAVKAALQEGADDEGGYLVPADELGAIILKRDEQNLLSQMGISGYTTDRDVFNFPAEGTAMTNFTIVAEEATHTPAQNEPTFAQAAATMYKFAKLVKISEELEEDYNSGLSGALTSMIGRAWAGTENYYAQVGTGSSQPQGVFVGGTAGLTLDSASAIGAAEIPELIGKLKIPYRNRAVMLMNRTTGAYLAGLSGNQFIFRQPPASQAWANGEDLGIGYPVILTEDAAAIGASAKSLLFGNFEFYGWVRNRSLRVLRLGELYRENGQIGIRAWFRAGGVVLQAEAFQYASHPTG